MKKIEVVITKENNLEFAEGKEMTVEELVISYLAARALSDDKSPEMVSAIAELYSAIAEN